MELRFSSFSKSIHQKHSPKAIDYSVRALNIAQLFSEKQYGSVSQSSPSESVQSSKFIKFSGCSRSSRKNYAVSAEIRPSPEKAADYGAASQSGTTLQSQLHPLPR
jgi:hypothetical protein